MPVRSGGGVAAKFLQSTWGARGEAWWRNFRKVPGGPGGRRSGEIFAKYLGGQGGGVAAKFSQSTWGGQGGGVAGLRRFPAQALSSSIAIVLSCDFLKRTTVGGTAMRPKPLLHFESRRLMRHWSRVTAPNPPDCSSSDCSSTDPNMPSLDYSSDEYF